MSCDPPNKPFSMLTKASQTNCPVFLKRWEVVEAQETV